MHARLLCPFALAIFLVGCGDGGPALGTVEGVVTLDGQPVVNAEVTFNPQGLKSGTASYGRTDAAGHYSLMFTRTKAGAMVGQHFVDILTERLSPAQIEERKQAGLATPDKQVVIPKKYRKPGELKADVQKGSNVINFSLTST